MNTKSVTQAGKGANIVDLRIMSSKWAINFRQSSMRNDMVDRKIVLVVLGVVILGVLLLSSVALGFYEISLSSPHTIL